MKTFSIITPVYNGQEYIANCINAIANANYDLTKIEHIVVDDGSTDNTKKICDELAKKYSHVKFYSKENGN
ncbi:MAG: glycosyltransferase [Mycoplasmoidaceae bacterium]|nr:glycosyltransferase [Mycoplasmoidaceae bacterium]